MECLQLILNLTGMSGGHLLAPIVQMNSKNKELILPSNKAIFPPARLAAQCEDFITKSRQNWKPRLYAGCIQGAVFDATVDMRPDSPTYLKWCGYELSTKNMRSLYIPSGVAHGFLTLEDDTQFFYMVSEIYSPEYEHGVRWNDPAIGIEWPISASVMTDKDKTLPLITKN